MKYYADHIIDDKDYNIIEEKEIEINLSQNASTNNIYVDIQSILNSVKSITESATIKPTN